MGRILSMTLALAAFLAGHAMAAPVEITRLPGTLAGTYGCTAKYPGSFRRGLTNECYACPRGYRRNLLAGIESAKACRRGGSRETEDFEHRSKPRLGLKPCPANTRLNPLVGCYRCPEGARLDPIARRCVRKGRARHAAADYKGRGGCPPGSFRNGLTSQCLSCPQGSVRAGLYARVRGGRAPDACMRVSIGAFAPPPWLKIDRALLAEIGEEIARHSALVATLHRAAGRFGKARRDGVAPEDYRDKALMDEIAVLSRRMKRRLRRGRCRTTPLVEPVEAVAFGVAVDGSVQTPLIVRAGGNVTREVIVDLEGGGTGTAWAFSLNAGTPGALTPLAGEAGVQVTAYADKGRALPSWTLAVEGGALGSAVIAAAGGEISLSIGFKKAPSGDLCPVIVGLTAGLKVSRTPGAEADIGPVYSRYID